MCACKALQSRRPLSGWTGPAASGTEKQSGTQEASGKCSSLGSAISLIGWQLGALCKQPASRYLGYSACSRLPPTGPNPGQGSQTNCFFFFFPPPTGQNFNAMRRWKGATMQKSHKNWGGAKELQLRKRISGQSFGSRVWKTGCVFLSQEGRFQNVCDSGRWTSWNYSHQ